MSDNMLDALTDEVRQRFDAINAQISDQLSDVRLSEMVKANLSEVLADENSEVVRKLRFGGERDPKLQGSKYAGLGLSASDVQLVHDLAEAARISGRGQGPSDELRNTVAAIQTGEYVNGRTLKASTERRLEEMLRSGDFKSYRDYERAVYAAMDTAESGYGSQLIGAQYVGELWRGARAEARVFNLINTFTMTDPTAYLPVESTLPAVSFVSESTASNSSNFATTKTGSNRVQVDAKKFVMHQMWSGEMEEDSIIAFLPFLREEAARGWAHALDSMVLNGDTTNAGTGNINLDDADPADTLNYLAFDGIRHAGLVDNTANSANIAGAISLNAFKSQKGRLLDTTYKHDWGHPNDLMDLVHVADPETCDAVSFLDEVLTVDKFGPGATVLTGQQARVLGNPLISSVDVSKTEADGKVSTTGSNNVKGQIVTFNRRGVVAGIRRDLKIEVERIPATDQSRIVYSTRMGLGRFSPTGAASGIEWADVLYNISL